MLIDVSNPTTISSPSCGAEWRLQFSCTSGVLLLLLNPNNQLVANRGVVSQISPDSELTENGLIARNFKRREGQDSQVLKYQQQYLFDGID